MKATANESQLAIAAIAGAKVACRGYACLKRAAKLGDGKTGTQSIILRRESLKTRWRQPLAFEQQQTAQLEHAVQIIEQLHKELASGTGTYAGQP